MKTFYTDTAFIVAIQLLKPSEKTPKIQIAKDKQTSTISKTYRSIINQQTPKKFSREKHY